MNNKNNSLRFTPIHANTITNIRANAINAIAKTKEHLAIKLLTETLVGIIGQEKVDEIIKILE